MCQLEDVTGLAALELQLELTDGSRSLTRANLPLVQALPRPAFAGLDDVVEQLPAIAYNEFLELLFC